MSTITLTRESVEDYTTKGGRHAWPLRVTAVSDLEGLSSKIFVYHASMGDDQFVGDIPEAVASVHQLYNVPEDAPEEISNTQIKPFYRKNVFLYFCYSPAQADQLWLEIQEDVQDLIENFKSLQNLTPSETFVTV